LIDRLTPVSVILLLFKFSATSFWYKYNSIWGVGSGQYSQIFGISFSQPAHQKRNTMKGVKWLGTFLCLTGICLTSFNVYPINIVLSLIGSALWTWAGWAQKDMPLFLVEAVAVAIYFAGILSLFTK
jgi:hypothetical protein